MVPRRYLTILLVFALLLPMAICLMLGAVWLLSAMQDREGALWLQRLAILCGLAWVMDGLVLLLALAGNSVCQKNDFEEPE